MIVKADQYCDISQLSGTGQDAKPRLQQCIDETTYGDILYVPTGLYSLESGLTIQQAISLVSNATVSCEMGDLFSCTTIQASPGFYSSTGLIHIVAGASNVNLDRLIIDGNRNNRLNSQSGNECKNNVDNRNSGRNGVSDSCSGCSITNSIIANALCASGFIWIGDSCTFTNNQIINNGDHFTQNMWADGITCLGCDRTEISGNYFAENSDIDLILGSGHSSYVHDNTFVHDARNNRPSFGALMLDNFASTTSGDYADARIENNNINCGSGTGCCYGIELGPHPWYASAPITGPFSLTNNIISGAGVGINVDAGGSAAAPVALNNNAIANTARSFTCGALCGITQMGSDINVSHDSAVTMSENNQASSQTTYACA